MMKVNILETGSAGNCIIATFSDSRKVIFDFGHGAWKLCIKENIDFHEVDNVLITHQHLDHCADYHRISSLNFSRWLKVKEFEVLHNCENKGFIVMNDKTQEGFIYMTDYHTIPPSSLETIKKHIAFTTWRWMIMMELSYCRFLYKKLDNIQRIGLQNHCSDERFFDYANQFLAVNRDANIISLHASARQGEFELGANKTGDVCPPDWCREQFYKRFAGASVRFGEAKGMYGTYNYIDRDFK